MSRPVAAAGAVDASSSLRPLVTVVVPVYNGGEEIVDNVDVIRRAVAEGLPGEEIEMIVVSDGSIDETAERCWLHGAISGFRVIHYDRNLGKGYAVKAGTLASHGDWVALIDADLDLDPASMPLYLEIARREQLDFAIGSKRHPDSVVQYPALAPGRELVVPATEPAALSPRRERHAGRSEGIQPSASSTTSCHSCS